MSEVKKHKAGALYPDECVILWSDHESFACRQEIIILENEGLKKAVISEILQSEISKAIHCVKDAISEKISSEMLAVEGYDSPEHAAQVADTLGHQVGELQISLKAAHKLLLDWYSANADGRITVADSAYSIVSATAELLSETDLQPAAELTHICPGCGAKGWTASCGQCVPF